ncbi:MAG TPA: ABC transporter permease [bacterium]|nr:ABC transporter permease [bacterium]
MKTILWKIYVLIRRDFIEELSYRMKFLIEIVTVIVYSSIFYFIAKVFAGQQVPYLERYGGDYFSFVLIGIAFSGFLNVGMSTFANTIRNEQVTGTLEILLSSPTSIHLVMTARMIWNFIYGGLHLIMYFVVGVFLLSANYPAVNWAAIPLILILSLAAFNGIGMISAGFIMIFKRGDPINVFISFASAFLGGVFFPVEVMPALLQKIAAFIPITYTLRLMRDACISGASFAELSHDFIFFAILCVFIVPAGILFFSYAVNRARRDGTITHY